MDEVVVRLKANAVTIEHLVSVVPLGEVRTRPAPDEWSLLEQICHLHDEERLDFKVRLASILETPERDWQPIDPEGWVVAHRYDEQDFQQVLADFLKERGRSVEWLQGLGTIDLTAKHTSKFGTMAAGDMLYAWVMHDLLHIRQLAATLATRHAARAKPYSVEYAG